MACLTCGDGCLVPLAGLEPATCWLGDVWVQTLCRTAKLLVIGEREAKVILWVLPAVLTRPQGRVYRRHQIHFRRSRDCDCRLSLSCVVGALAVEDLALQSCMAGLDQL